MKTPPVMSLMLAVSLSFACAGGAERGDAEAMPAVDPMAGQASVQDDESQPDIVKIAVGSADHTTLVAALKAANLVNALANAGPFTVFAPTNAAFDKLPQGALDDLLKPANEDQLRNTLQHHVTTSVFTIADLTDGMTLGMADGKAVTIHKVGDEVTVDGAKIIASVRGTNGMVHVVDAVILPAAK